MNLRLHDLSRNTRLPRVKLVEPLAEIREFAVLHAADGAQEVQVLVSINGLASALDADLDNPTRLRAALMAHRREIEQCARAKFRPHFPKVILKEDELSALRSQPH